MMTFLLLIPESTVGARLHVAARSALGQPHMRSPFATAAPISSIPRAAGRGSEDGTILTVGIKPWPSSVRPPGSV